MNAGHGDTISGADDHDPILHQLIKKFETSRNPLSRMGSSLDELYMGATPQAGRRQSMT
jgi:hypothetical protein